MSNKITPAQPSTSWVNSDDQWGIISRSFHWIMALYIIGMLSIGFYMASLTDMAVKGPLIWMHKSFGVLFFVLLVLRFTWRQKNTIPSIPANSFHTISKLSAPILYLSMLMMPLSGLLMSQAAGYPVSFFGLFTLPTILSKSPELAQFFQSLHAWSAFILIGLIVIHTIASLFHHFVIKDRILVRMLTSKRD